jgi:hypothetical protein
MSGEHLMHFEQQMTPIRLLDKELQPRRYYVFFIKKKKMQPNRHQNSRVLDKLDI